MADDYTGPERRKEHCALHDILWDHHEKDTVNHRQTVCTKIKELADVAKAALPMKTFMIVLTLASMVSASAFGLLWNGLEKNQSDIKESLATIHRRITDKDKDYDQLNESVLKMRWSVEGMSNRLNEVENRINQLHSSPADTRRK